MNHFNNVDKLAGTVNTYAGYRLAQMEFMSALVLSGMLGGAVGLVVYGFLSLFKRREDRRGYAVYLFSEETRTYISLFLGGGVFLTGLYKFFFQFC